MKAAANCERRARPLLGTLVEVGARGEGADTAIAAAFIAIGNAQALLSRFDRGSDIARFNALPRGGSLDVGAITATVLAAARALQRDSAGLFDISLGSGPADWELDGGHLLKRGDAVRLDLGGIGKGCAVDLGVQALQEAGAAAGWVNAGGDLRVFGALDLPLHLRCERRGGVRAFARLRDGAFATSAFGAAQRAQLAVADAHAHRLLHVSVAAPHCLWADALTKVVAASGDAAHPLLARHGAQAWIH